MTCPKCGKPTPTGARFCAYCGTPLAAREEPVPAAKSEPASPREDAVDLRPLSANPVRPTERAYGAPFVPPNAVKNPRKGARAIQEAEKAFQFDDELDEEYDPAPRRKNAPSFEDEAEDVFAVKPAKPARKKPVHIDDEYEEPADDANDEDEAQLARPARKKTVKREAVSPFARPAAKKNVKDADEIPSARKKAVPRDDEDDEYDEYKAPPARKKAVPRDDEDDEYDEFVAPPARKKAVPPEDEDEAEEALLARPARKKAVKQPDEDDDFGWDAETPAERAKRAPLPERKPLPRVKPPVSHIRPVSQDKPIQGGDTFLFEDEYEDPEESVAHTGHRIRLLALLTVAALVVLGVYFFKATDTGRRLRAMLEISDSASDYMLLADNYLSDGKKSDAASAYYAALKLNPNDYDFCLRVAEGMVLSGDSENAVKLYKRMYTELDKDRAEAYDNLLALYQTLGWTNAYDELLAQRGGTPQPDAPTPAPAVPEQVSVAAPVPSVNAGSYDHTVQLKLTCVSGADIYYTINGSDPDTDSLLYTGMLLLSDSQTYEIRAVAVLNGVYSPVWSGAYTIDLQ